MASVDLTTMIICPNCNYQNPEGASQCEACYTPLPAITICSNCGAEVQADASFCGQCGHPMTAQPAEVAELAEATAPVETAENSSETVPLSAEPVAPDPLVVPDPLTVGPPPPLPVEPDSANIPTAVDIYTEPPVTTQPATVDLAAPQTQLQTLTSRLLHVQTNTVVELPIGLNLLHIGKPNERVPPDIDVSGFPESEIVSRVHASIRIEGDVYYIEDVGSSNGTYVNNLPLAVGNRHRLRPGDRIALGKGDKVSFIFQLS